MLGLKMMIVLLQIGEGGKYCVLMNGESNSQGRLAYEGGRSHPKA